MEPWGRNRTTACHMIARGGAGERRQGPHACVAAFARNLSQCVHKQRNLKTQCYERTWSWHADSKPILTHRCYQEPTWPPLRTTALRMRQDWDSNSAKVVWKALVCRTGQWFLNETFFSQCNFKQNSNKWRGVPFCWKEHARTHIPESIACNTFKNSKCAVQHSLNVTENERGKKVAKESLSWLDQILWLGASRLQIHCHGFESTVKLKVIARE